MVTPSDAYGTRVTMSSPLMGSVSAKTVVSPRMIAAERIIQIMDLPFLILKPPSRVASYIIPPVSVNSKRKLSPFVYAGNSEGQAQTSTGVRLCSPIRMM